MTKYSRACKQLPFWLAVLNKIGSWGIHLRRRNHQLPPVPRKVLLICLENIPEVIHTLPAIQTLKKAFPEIRMDYMGGDWMQSLLSAHPAIDHTLIYQAPWIACETPSAVHQKANPFVKGWELRKNQYDTIICFQPDFRLKLIAAMTGAPLRIGYGLQDEFLLTHTSMFEDTELRYLQHLKLLEIFQISDLVTDPKIIPPSSDVNSTQAILDGLQPNRRLIVIRPGGTRIEFQWEVAKFRTLIEQCIKDEFQVLILGGPGETELLNEITVDMVSENVQIWNFPTFGEVAALAKYTSIYLGLNSSTSHVMAAMGVPSVILCGSQKFTGTLPMGLDYILIYSDTVCDKCKAGSTDKSAKQNCTCMKNISVEQVITAYETQVKTLQKED
ncbi:glycosyltransferase family 9 protein [bacterium]|nr:glycosyltransferase family 9 protein [candidate division CSSED10-310 bacterium]